MPPGRPSRQQAPPVGERLRQVREKLALSQEAMALRVGLTSYRSWQEYERGKTMPSARVLKDLARLGFSVDWILTGGGPMTIGIDPEDLDEMVRRFAGQFVFLPRYYSLPGEPAVEPLAFRRDWIESHLGIRAGSCKLVTAEGDSMSPTISDGDLLLVHMDDQELGRPGIFALTVEHGVLVRRIARSVAGDALIVSSDNAAYGSQTLGRREAASLRIIGRVVWAGGRV